MKIHKKENVANTADSVCSDVYSVQKSGSGR